MIDKFKINANWREAFPGAHIGILLVGNVDNSKGSSALDDKKRQVVTSMREKYAGYDRKALVALPVLSAYKNYYKTFRKTYHVQLQLESILFKGKSLPTVTPLVDANFAAEMETMLLTAGHDGDRLEWPVTIGVSEGNETFARLGAHQQQLKANDMMMSDRRGVVCTVIYGQDQRTPISHETKRVLYVTYAPAGITRETVERHLEKIKSNILLFAPEARVEYQAVQGAG
jgi:DNA/RNA-binding domain of Phe-tRNA-synthetase-like protein